MDNQNDSHDENLNSTSSSFSQSFSTGTEEFINLESLIKNYAFQIENLQKELKEKNQMLKDAFESDAIYKEKELKAKESSKEKMAIKKEILKRPELKDLQERIKEIKFDIAEHNSILSDYLQQYYRQTGANQIDLGNGEVMEIVTVTKLVRKAFPKEE